MSSMGEQDRSRKVADRNAAFANKTLEKGRATMEQSARAAEQSYSTAVENMRNYNLKMLDMAQANVEAVFEVARQLATAKTPADMIELCTAHAHKQFELLSEQTNELTALGQRWTGESVEPIARSVTQAFSKAS
jgi:hypothetical protein